MSEVLRPETPDNPAVPDLLACLTLADAVVFPSMVKGLLLGWTSTSQGFF